MIALQRYDVLIVARTATGHSYTNPRQKVDCILNIDLNAIGCM